MSEKSWAPNTNRLGMHELASQINSNRLLRDEPGLNFARKVKGATDACRWCTKPIRHNGIVWIEVAARSDRFQMNYVCPALTSKYTKHPHEPVDAQPTAKDEARLRVMRLFTGDAWWGELRLLTMPGTQWRLERPLLDDREGGGEWRKDHEPRTFIHGIECLDAIYRVGCLNVPGRMQGVRMLEPPVFGTGAIATRKVDGYFRCRFEDMAHWLLKQGVSNLYDAAWLDFNGPMSKETMWLIGKLWTREVITTRLVLTFLKGRHQVGDEIADAGGIVEWVVSHLPGCGIEDEWSYADPAPMLQLSLRRT